MEPNSLTAQSIIFILPHADVDKIKNASVLPIDLCRRIEETREEIDRWNEEMRYLGRACIVTTVENYAKVFESLTLVEILRLHVSSLSWQTSKGTMVIDRQTSAQRILADFDPRRHHTNVTDIAFKLAATYCLEEQIRRLWPRCSQNGPPWNMPNVPLTYWTDTMRNRPLDARGQLELLTPDGFCNGRLWSSVFRCFWTIILREFGGLPSLQWMHTAMIGSIRLECEELAHFLWNQLAVESRTSLALSSNTLLKSIVAFDLYEIFFEIWNSIEQDDLRRKMFETFYDIDEIVYADRRIGRRIGVRILKTFVIGRTYEHWTIESRNNIAHFAHGFFKRSKIVGRRRRFVREYGELIPLMVARFSSEEFKFVWNEATDAQRIHWLISDDFAIFREMCGVNHGVMAAKLLWNMATPDQRHSMITARACEALNVACDIGQLPLVEYFWQDMDSRTALHAIGLLRVTSFCRLISFGDTLFWSPEQRLEAFLLLMLGDRPDDEQSKISTIATTLFHRALLSCHGMAFKRLCHRATHGGNPAILVALMNVFEDDEQRSRLRAIMCKEEAILCAYDDE